MTNNTNWKHSIFWWSKVSVARSSCSI